MPANIKDVAKAAGVGTTTVSVILNKPKEAGRFSDETIQHVRKVAEKLGYQPNQRARSFRGGRTQVLGLAVDYYGQGRSPLAEPYLGAIAGGIQSGLWEHDYNLLLVSGQGEQLSMEVGCNYMRQGRIDGLILLTPPPAGMLRKHADLKSRMVLIRPRSEGGLACVYTDDAAGAELAVKEFADRGHTDLAWIGPQEWYDDSSERRAGAFEQACTALKIKCVRGTFSRPDEFHSYHRPGVLSGEAFSATERVLKRKRRPTGILCYNAQCATGVYEAIAKAGLSIPDDISVMTFEGFASNFFVPHLSAVRLRWQEVGKRAGERLLEALGPENRKLSGVEWILPDFFEGESVR
jgi:LacI family transcriptional regulator